MKPSKNFSISILKVYYVQKKKMKIDIWVFIIYVYKYDSESVLKGVG